MSVDQEKRVPKWKCEVAKCRKPLEHIDAYTCGLRVASTPIDVASMSVSGEIALQDDLGPVEIILKHITLWRRSGGF